MSHSSGAQEEEGQCWTCGGNHPSEDCPHKISGYRLPTPKPGSVDHMVLPDTPADRAAKARAAAAGGGAKEQDSRHAQQDAVSEQEEQQASPGAQPQQMPAVSPPPANTSTLHHHHHHADGRASPSAAQDGDDQELSFSSSARPELRTRRTVSWADDTCVIEEVEGGEGRCVVHQVPLAEADAAHHQTNRCYAASMRNGRNEFSVDTGRLSLLTLRYVVAQMWSLTQVRLALTLLLSGLTMEGLRFWQLSVPALVLFVSTVYVTQHMWKPLAAAPSEAVSQQVYSWFKTIFKDKNRVRVILFCLQVLPVNMQIYSLVIVTLRVHQYPTLALLLFVFVSTWLLASKTVLAVSSHSLRIRVTKLGIYAVSFAYLLLCREWDSALRLVGPCLITTGCMMFLTLPTEEVDLATRGAVTLMLKDVMVMANERLVTEHELIQIGLNRWILEYWDGPSDFTWEDFLPMMQYVFETMREELPESTWPTLQTLQKRMERLHTDPLGAALVHRIRTDVGRIAPPKRFSLLLILSRATRHLLCWFLSLAVMAVFLPKYRCFPYALLPLTIVDVLSVDRRGPRLLKLLSPLGSDSDGLSMLLTDAEGLLGVWDNLRQALEACQTGLRSRIKVLAHSDKAELFITTMKAYQAMAHARQHQQAAAGTGGGSKGGAATVPAGPADWNFKSGWAMIELLRLRSTKGFEGMDGTSDSGGIYRSGLTLYLEWLVDAPGHFNQWLHSAIFTATRAAVPFSTRTLGGSSSLHASNSLSMTMQPKTPAAGAMLALSPWNQYRDNQFFAGSADPLAQSMFVGVEAMPTPASARAIFWWQRAGGPSFVLSSPETDDDPDASCSGGAGGLGSHASMQRTSRSSPLRTAMNNAGGKGGGRTDRMQVTRVKGLFAASPASLELAEEGEQEAASVSFKDDHKEAQPIATAGEGSSPKAAGGRESRPAPLNLKKGSA